MRDRLPNLDHLFSATYEELRRLAATIPRDGNATLNPTALVNEAYLRLAASLDQDPESRLHFKRVAARAMRHILVEAARRRKAAKRGGDAAMVTLNEEVDGFSGRSDQLLALDAALTELAQINPRHARMVELRFFGGYDVAETALLLGTSESTVARDWRAARSWLAMTLRRA